MAKSKDEGSKMKWTPAPAELVKLFGELTEGLEGAEKRKMFGYPCCFANGNMFAGLHQKNMIIRLSEEERFEFKESFGAEQFVPMPGRVMKEYMVIPGKVLEDVESLRLWLNKSLNYTKTLPVKEKNAKKK